MNEVVMYPRTRKANRTATASGRATRGSIAALQEQLAAEMAVGAAEMAVGAAGMAVGAAGMALPAMPGPAPLDPQRAGSGQLDRLHASLSAVTAASHPRTAKLLGSGMRRPAQKLIEEAGEVALEAVSRDTGGVVRESADLLYHLVVLWRRAGVDPAEVWIEMARRADAYGIAEKIPK
jgi:phosphoribosyl-ATP pyrophosphohydrolase